MKNSCSIWLSSLGRNISVREKHEIVICRSCMYFCKIYCVLMCQIRDLWGTEHSRSGMALERCFWPEQECHWIKISEWGQAFVTDFPRAVGKL